MKRGKDNNEAVANKQISFITNGLTRDARVLSTVKSDVFVAISETLKSGPVHFWFASGHFISMNMKLDQMIQPPRCGTIYSAKRITHTYQMYVFVTALKQQKKPPPIR